MTIGARIKDRRNELGKTVDEVAAALGKNRATIYRYESDYIEKLPADILVPLARVLSTTPAFLMGWTDDPTDYENSQEVLEAPLDVIEALDGDAKKIYEYMRAVDEDRAAESAEQAQQALLLSLFNKLNSLGKDRALEFIEDLAQMEKYTNEK